MFVCLMNRILFDLYGTAWVILDPEKHYWGRRKGLVRQKGA